MFHTTQMLRQLSYYNGTPKIRRMTAAVPELTMAMQTLATMLDMSGRATNLCAAMSKSFKEAHGDPELVKRLKAPDLGYVKVDIFADSALIFHPAATTPGASILNGKLVKPKGFEHSVAGLHKLIKDFCFGAMHAGHCN